MGLGDTFDSKIQEYNQLEVLFFFFMSTLNLLISCFPDVLYFILMLCFLSFLFLVS